LLLQVDLFPRAWRRPLRGRDHSARLHGRRRAGQPRPRFEAAAVGRAQPPRHRGRAGGGHVLSAAKISTSSPGAFWQDSGMPTTRNYPAVTPYLIVPDGDAMLTFAKHVFGATERMVQRHEDGTVGHAELTIGDSLIMVGQAGGPWKPRTAALYL